MQSKKLNEMNNDLEAKETAKKPKGNELVGWGYFDKKRSGRKERGERKGT